MAGNYPFAVDSLKSIKIQKSDGSGEFNVFPWEVNSLSPLISLSIDENLFNPLMSGTLIVKDVGDWSNELNLKTFDQLFISFVSKRRGIELDGNISGSVLSTNNLIFEITNIKNTVNLANQAFQNGLENTKVITIEFVSKSIISKELLSSLLGDENFIGPIASNSNVNVTLDGEESQSITMTGFNSYIQEKLGMSIDADPTFNYCYLKRNNVSYPWGKLKGQPTILQTLQYLSENAVDSENSASVNYLFWQDLDGFHFRSISSLIADNNQQETSFTYNFSDVELFTTTIHSFETLTEFDEFKLINSDVYFSWYERFTPDFSDPYADYVDSTVALKKQKISYNGMTAYGEYPHIESGGVLNEELMVDNEIKFPESRRKDDDIYGFFSKNRYNTPHPVDWEYLGISADTRLSNVVWQTQYDIDDQVKPELVYAYDKLIRKASEKNRENYVNLKNAKRKWEVFRCGACCTNQLGGTADQAIIANIQNNPGDYVYYFGPTGIFGNLQVEGYGVVAAGAFSDAVNFIRGLTGVTNGLTYAYDLNSEPYNQNIEQFYYLKRNLDALTGDLDGAINQYTVDLNSINSVIGKMRDLLDKIPTWRQEAINLAYNNLTPNFIQTCNYRGIGRTQEENENPTLATHGPGTGNCSCRPSLGGNLLASDINYLTKIPEIRNASSYDLYTSGIGIRPFDHYIPNNDQNVSRYVSAFHHIRAFSENNDRTINSNTRYTRGAKFVFGIHVDNCLDDVLFDYYDEPWDPRDTPSYTQMKKLPLYVNLSYDNPQKMINGAPEFNGYADLLIKIPKINNRGTNEFDTVSGAYLYCSSLRQYALTSYDGILCGILELCNSPKLSEKEAWELPFIKPPWLYECSKTKLIAGNYYRTTESLDIPKDISADLGNNSFAVGLFNLKGLLITQVFNILDFDNVSQSSDVRSQDSRTLSEMLDAGVAWCGTCLDPISLVVIEKEYEKVYKQLTVKKLVLEKIIERLNTLKNKFENLYNEYMDRKAFFISKDPFDPGVTGNIVNKRSPLCLTQNIKSIKRKPIRGSRYEILAKRYGVTAGLSGDLPRTAGEYLYKIYFDDDDDRNIGITGNHPYYDQKYKSFGTDEDGITLAYATKDAFDVEYYSIDPYYYDDDIGRVWTQPFGDYSVGLYYSGLENESEISDTVSNERYSIPTPIRVRNNLRYPSTPVLETTLSENLSFQTLKTLTSTSNKFNSPTGKPPSIKKEEISSYVRIEFMEPIGLDRLADFPSGFVRDAGSEYFLPYIVQITPGPHGRQSIQSHVAVIGIDPYGFDVAVKKIKTKNNYNDYKDWGYYWWHTPVNKLRIQNKTKDISEMSLWAEKSFDNEFSYFQNSGPLFYDVGHDFSEYNDYVADALRFGSQNGQIYPGDRTSGAFFSAATVRDVPTSSIKSFYNIPLSDSYNNPSNTDSYYTNNISPYINFERLDEVDILRNTNLSSDVNEIRETNNIKIPKSTFDRSLRSYQYGSYELLSSHSHYNIRRSWYDFGFPSRTYLKVQLRNFANANNQIFGYEPETVFFGYDITFFGGNDLLGNDGSEIEIASSQQLTDLLDSLNFTTLIYDNADIAGNNLLNTLKEDSFNSLNPDIEKLFSDDIEHAFNADFYLYKPGLLSSQVWMYDIFGETEYGLVSPPTLPPEYDNFDNNFSAQFVVFGQTVSEANICKKLGIKCISPNGYVNNIGCEPNDPYCECSGKTVIPKVREPSYKELAIAFNKTKECELIKDVLGEEYLGCILSDDQNVISCNCPEQGEKFKDLLATIRTHSTFYSTPPETPLRRNAQMMLFNAQRAMMMIFPNDELKIGTILTINKPNPSSDYANKYERVSGKWMVTGISRIFKSANIEHMIVSLNRDSTQLGSSTSATTYGRDIF
jgi:hypothetical protein